MQLSITWNYSLWRITGINISQLNVPSYSSSLWAAVKSQPQSVEISYRLRFSWQSPSFPTIPMDANKFDELVGGEALFLLHQGREWWSLWLLSLTLNIISSVFHDNCMIQNTQMRVHTNLYEVTCAGGSGILGSQFSSQNKGAISCSSTINHVGLLAGGSWISDM